MDDDAVLAVLYRGRPATIAAAAVLTHLPPDDLADRVERLRERGSIGGDGQTLAYPHPAEWVAEVIGGEVSTLQRDTQMALSRIAGIVGALPGMLRHWSVGQEYENLVPVITRHGPHASEDLWYDVIRHETGILSAVLPHVGRFLNSADERIARFAAALRAKDAVRVIVPTSCLDDPAAVDSIRRYSAAGVDYRVLEQPPSWFWVDGDQFAMPHEWGEGRPTSVIAVRHAGMAGMAEAYFAELWRTALPLTPGDGTWVPLLQLMRRGITLDTASRMLGINPRTGRRRIAAAMEHYGVSTLFALGTAWAADAERD